MSALPRVLCDSVELRLVTPRAAHQLFALARDPDVSRLLQWDAHETVDDSLSYIHDARSLWERRVAWLPGIFDRERGQLVGCVGLHGIDHANARAESGTWIGVPYQGAGHYLPAKAAIAAFAFDVLGLRRLEFLVRVDNERSLRAIRRLPGIREEGVLGHRIMREGMSHDAVMFALLADDFDRDEWPEIMVDLGNMSL